MSSITPVASKIEFIFPKSSDYFVTVPGMINSDGMYHAFPLTLPEGPRFNHLRGEEQNLLYAQVGDHVPKSTNGPSIGEKRPRPAASTRHVTIRYTIPALAMEREMMFERQEEHAYTRHQVEIAYAKAFQARAELEADPKAAVDDLVAAACEMHSLTKGRNKLRAARRVAYELKQETKWFLVEAGVPCRLGGVPGKPWVRFECKPGAMEAEVNVLLPQKDEAKVITKSTPVRPERLDFQAIGQGAFAAAFSPDGKRVVSGHGDHSVRIWDSASGEVLQELKGHGSNVSSVAFSPDGKHIVSGGDDETVRVWDSASGLELKKLRTPRNRVALVAFLPDGKHVLSAGSSGMVSRCNLDTEEFDLQFSTRFYQVYSMALSGCATKLITGSHGRVLIFDTETGLAATDLRGHHGQCNAVCFSHDGKHAVSAGDDGVLRCTNITSKAVVWEVKTEQSFNAVTVSGDDAFIVVGDTGGRVLFRDAQTGRFLYEMRLESRVMSLAFSPEDSHLLVATRYQSDSNKPDVCIHLWSMTPFLDELRQ